MVGGGDGHFFKSTYLMLIHFLFYLKYDFESTFLWGHSTTSLYSLLILTFFRKRMEDGVIKKAPMHEPNFEHKHKRGHVYEHQCEQHEYVCEHKSEHQRTVSSS